MIFKVLKFWKRYLKICRLYNKPFLGIQIQKRTCSNPPPSNNGKPCVGSDQNAKKCNLGQCPEWQSWSKFSTCSKECGSGVQSRTRVCKIFANDQSCVGDREETRTCEGFYCSIGKCWFLLKFFWKMCRKCMWALLKKESKQSLS